MSLLGLQRKLPMEMVTCPENPKHHILLCSKSHMSMKRVWSHNGNKQTIARKSVSFKSESCSGNLQFISLTLWQHHRDGAVWAEPDFIYFFKKRKEKKKKVIPVQPLRSPRSGDELCWSKQHRLGQVVYSNDRLVLPRLRLRLREEGRRNLPPESWLTPGRRNGEPADQSPAECMLHLQGREKEKVSIRYAWQITCRVCCTSLAKTLSAMMEKTEQ